MRFRRSTWPRELSDAVGGSATGRKESILAAAQLADGNWVAGTRAAVYLPADDTPTDVDAKPTKESVRRVGWEQIERAGWDSEASVLHVYETTAFGTPLRATDLKLTDPGRFGQLLRERVDASIVVQRHVPLAGKRGVRIVGRRNPATTEAPITWNFVLDKGLEPSQPGIVDAAEAALAAVREEFGL